MGNDLSLLSDREINRIAQYSKTDILKLYRRFKELDLDGSGTLEPSELMQISKDEANPLMERVIEVFDTDGSASISFLEFLVGIGRLSAAATAEDKEKFLFEVYDVNKDGFISHSDLFKVMKMMVGTNLNDQQLQQLVDRAIRNADKEYNGRLSFEQFQTCVKSLKIAEQFH